MQAIDQGVRALVELVVSRFQLTLKHRYSTTICRAGGCGVEEERRLRIKENTLPFDTYPTQSGTARVPRVGEGADKLYSWPSLIRDKNRMR
jgi:hypothetical protein